MIKEHDIIIISKDDHVVARWSTSDVDFWIIIYIGGGYFFSAQQVGGVFLLPAPKWQFWISCVAPFLKKKKKQRRGSRRKTATHKLKQCDNDRPSHCFLICCRISKVKILLKPAVLLYCQWQFSLFVIRKEVYLSIFICGE